MEKPLEGGVYVPLNSEFRLASKDSMKYEYEYVGYEELRKFSGDRWYTDNMAENFGVKSPGNGYDVNLFDEVDQNQFDYDQTDSKEFMSYYHPAFPTAMENARYKLSCETTATANFLSLLGIKTSQDEIIRYIHDNKLFKKVGDNTYIDNSENWPNFKINEKDIIGLVEKSYYEYFEKFFPNNKELALKISNNAFKEDYQKFAGEANQDKAFVDTLLFYNNNFPATGVFRIDIRQKVRAKIDNYGGGINTNQAIEIINEKVDKYNETVEEKDKKPGNIATDGPYYSVEQIAEAIEAGKGVMVQTQLNILAQSPKAPPEVTAPDHFVLIVGASYDKDGNVTQFKIVDSGNLYRSRLNNRQNPRVISRELFEKACTQLYYKRGWEEKRGIAGVITVGSVYKPIITNNIRIFDAYPKKNKNMLQAYLDYKNQLMLVARANYLLGEKRHDPLVFDLDGNGIETIALYNSDVFFDLDDDGFNERVGWISKDDGLLIIDQNNNGKVDDINELFGNVTMNGFEELKLYDSNSDGIIDANDADFTKMKIWQDLNENGISEAGEMKSLTEVGIKNINLNYDMVDIVNNGNVISETSTFELTDGTIRTVADLNLSVNETESISTQNVMISFDIMQLPQLRGYGAVTNLPESMVNNPELKAFIEILASETDITKVWEAMDDLLAIWAGVDGIDPDALRGEYSAKKLAVIERFIGQEYQGIGAFHYGFENTSDVISFTSVVSVDQAYQIIKGMQFAHLVAQTIVLDALDGSYYNMLEDQVIFPDDITNVLNNFAKLINNSDEYTAACLSLVLNILKRESNLDVTALSGQIDSQWYDVISATKGLNIGNSSDNLVIGTNASDLLYGFNGNDKIYGLFGNDVINAGAGDDIIDGGQNNDTYIFNLGDGKDTIDHSFADTYQTSETIDIIKFGAGITKDNLEISARKAELIITILDSNNNPTGDEITIKGGLKENAYIDWAEFSDGTTMTFQNMIDTIGPVYGDIDDNTLDGTYVNDIISADEGNDIVYAYEGNDLITGGTGNDILQGGLGDDTYIFNPGDGQDTIEDAGDVDKITFGAGIASSNLSYSASGSNLIITLLDSNGIPTGDKITIINGLSTDGIIETLEFSDSSIVDFNFILSQLPQVTGTQGDDVIEGSIVSDIINTYAGNDTITAHAGDDYIDAGSGNDVINGDAGNDTITAGEGDDTIYGGPDNDTYIFNFGDGQDGIFDYTEYNQNAGTADRILFGAGITQANIEFTGYHRDLIISLKDNNGNLTGDKITITNGFMSPNKIERYEFEDGSYITYEDIPGLLPPVNGTTGDDFLYGSMVGDVVNGNSGNDTITLYKKCS